MVCAALVLVASRGVAQDAVAEVDVRSELECPDSLALRRALLRVGIQVLPQASRHVILETQRGGEHFVLVADDERLERDLESRDCEAIAEVSAFIVRRHLRKLTLSKFPAAFGQHKTRNTIQQMIVLQGTLQRN